MKGLWIALAVLLLLALLLLLPLGVRAESSGGAWEIALRVGCFRFRPGRKKKKKTGKKTEKPKEKKDRKELFRIFKALWPSVCKALRRTVRRLTVAPLRLSLTIGGDDPAESALFYGKADALVWTVMPRLSELCRIPDPQIHIGVDYSAEKSRAEGKIGVSLRLIDLLIIAFMLLIPFVRLKRAEKETVLTGKENEDGKNGEKCTAEQPDGHDHVENP